MEKRNQIIITFFFLIFLILGLYFFTDWFSRTTGYFIESSPENTLAKCLTEKGVKFYGSKSCPDCEKQKQLFGPQAARVLNYIECSKEPQDCSNLQLLPAWYIKDKIHYGIKSLAELQLLSGCVE